MGEAEGKNLAPRSKQLDSSLRPCSGQAAYAPLRLRMTAVAFAVERYQSEIPTIPGRTLVRDRKAPVIPGGLSRLVGGTSHYRRAIAGERLRCIERPVDRLREQRWGSVLAPQRGKGHTLNEDGPSLC
jgi:hypothetical protein